MINEPSYIDVIERYHQYRGAIHELIESLMTGIMRNRLLDDESERHRAMKCLSEKYPFVDLLYILDKEGVQKIGFLDAGEEGSHASGRSKGRDRSQRPYFIAVKEGDGVAITEPYFSIEQRQLCVSAAVKIQSKKTGESGYLVLDFDLRKKLSFLMGDALRHHFEPFFRAVYGVIVLALMIVVFILLYMAFAEVASLFFDVLEHKEQQLKPFGIIIFLTLGLAVFDLGKTVLEEEVLMPKDIFRMASTRRTITRFVGAILIAVLIEALLLMFKSVLGDTEHLIGAVWMMMAAVGLLVGLGIYLYLACMAEKITTESPVFVPLDKKK